MSFCIIRNEDATGGRRNPDKFRSREILGRSLLGLPASARQDGLGRDWVSPTIRQRGRVSIDSVPLGCHVAKCRCRPQDNQGRGIVNGLRRSPSALGQKGRGREESRRDERDQRVGDEVAGGCPGLGTARRKGREPQNSEQGTAECRREKRLVGAGFGAGRRDDGMNGILGIPRSSSLHVAPPHCLPPCLLFPSMLDVPMF